MAVCAGPTPAGSQGSCTLMRAASVLSTSLLAPAVPRLSRVPVCSDASHNLSI